MAFANRHGIQIAIRRDTWLFVSKAETNKPDDDMFAVRKCQWIIFQAYTVAGSSLARYGDA